MVDRLVKCWLGVGLLLVVTSSGPSLVAQGGQWAGPWQWDVPTVEEEIGHAVLLSVGPHRGKVLMWGFEETQAINKSYIWDPANPSTRTLINQSVSYNLFCSGVTAQADGKLVLGEASAPMRHRPTSTRPSTRS